VVITTGLARGAVDYGEGSMVRNRETGSTVDAAVAFTLGYSRKSCG